MTGYALPVPGIPEANPPGYREALYAIPGSLGALAGSYWWGARREPDGTKTIRGHRSRQPWAATRSS